MRRNTKLGIFCILTATLIFTSFHVYYYTQEKNAEEMLTNYFEISQKKESYNYEDVSPNYLGVLEIPKLNLQKGFLNIDNPDNTINKNIQVLNNSTMPNEENHLLVIAAHSGNSPRSYFKDLDDLTINDEVNIYYNNSIYHYQIYDIQNILKDGTLEVYETYATTLILTTCNQKDKNKQIVIYAKLISVEI